MTDYRLGLHLLKPFVAVQMAKMMIVSAIAVPLRSSKNRLALHKRSSRLQEV